MEQDHQQQEDPITPTRAPLRGPAAPATGGVSVVDRLLHDVDRLPGSQPVLLRLAQRVDDPDSSTSDLVELCAADPAFAARVLRLSNSAYYGRSGTVTALGPAIGVLGRTTLRTTALAMALGLGGEHGRLPEGFAGRAGLVAASAQLVAADVGASAGDALCAGLLCDLGSALLHRAAPAAYGALLREAPGDLLPAAERAWCGTSHAELGAQVLRLSGVPEAVCRAIAQHHDPLPDGGPLAVAVRAGVLVAGDDVTGALAEVTGGRLGHQDGPRLALAAAAGAAALSALLG